MKRTLALFAVGTVAIALSLSARADAGADNDKNKSSAAPPPATLKVSSVPTPQTPQAPAPSIPSTSAAPDGNDAPPEDLTTRMINGLTSDPEVIAAESMQAHRQQQEAEENPSFEQQAQNQTEDQDDWMLRDYTAALKKKGLANTPDTDPDAVLQPDKSTLLPSINDDPGIVPADDDANQHPVANANKPFGANDTDSDVPQAFSTGSLAPLISQGELPPLLETTANPARDPLAIREYAEGDDPLGDLALKPVAPPVLTRDSRTSDSLNFLDTPGMTAAQDGLGAPATDDVSLQDPLPGQDSNEDVTRGKPKIDRDDFLVPTAPTNDVTDFFKKQAEAFQPPTAPTASQLPIVQAKPYVPPVNAFPLAKPTLAPGIHSHIDDPFDILQR